MSQQGHRKPTRAGRPTDAGHAEDWRRDLRDAIVSRVVPRLAEPADVRHEGVDRFAALCLAGSVAQLAAALEARRASGATVESLILDLVAPAARHLGDLWLLDRVSFLDVTAGLGRLQALVRELGPALEAGARGPSAGRKVLLAPAPGEQHVFGLCIVGAFFRRAGWEVAFEPQLAFDELLGLAGAESFTAIGLTAAGDVVLDRLPDQVAALRRASLNRDVLLLAGGPAFLEDPCLAARVGVDAAPRDAAEAVREAERLAARVPA